ncbi:MAG: hypothetical protein LBG27_06595 [Spirochaetaceae bacterium]|nr:hypothetical protein [Spirochaetaceae bacterium]
MNTPLVEIDGDEMTRVLWVAVKETLLEPFVELKTECYDLSVTERDKTGDRVLLEIKKRYPFEMRGLRRFCAMGWG